MSRAADSMLQSEQLRERVRQYGYGTILIGALLVLWFGVAGPFPIGRVANALYIFVIFLLLGLELWIPYRPAWGDIRRASRADVIYFLLAAPIDALQIFLLVGLLAQTAPYHHYVQVLDVWPNDAPILLQLLLALLIVDFFKYWYHRWTHEVPALWRIHSVHHSLDRLEMLRASFFHPIDIFLTVGTGTLAMLMVGVNYELIIFHNVFAGITGLLNHSNADLRCGVFDTFLNSPDHHRAHHSVGLPGSHSNYGSFFNFTDRLFGTRYLPRTAAEIGSLGLDESYRMPRSFLGQLVVPLRWRQVRGAT